MRPRPNSEPSALVSDRSPLPPRTDSGRERRPFLTLARGRVMYRILSYYQIVTPESAEQGDYAESGAEGDAVNTVTGEE